jgi:hypothetical protein
LTGSGDRFGEDFLWTLLAAKGRAPMDAAQ